MKLDKNGNAYYMLMTTIGITMAAIPAYAILFLTSAGAMFPFWFKVGMAVLTYVSTVLWAYSNRPHRRQ